MASFNDIIPQFNPYVQQLPVEAMVEVGMQKQKQYNEGIQKIQTSIDSIAGMDVVRDIDKIYLQSKLNEVGNQLKTVAAGDFSNFQLANSSAGMVNKIANDKNVLNAVSSTQKYRKEVENMEKAKSEGKSSIQNQWDFMNKANNWLSSLDLSQKFNDAYTPYTDVDKKWFDIYKGLHSDLLEEDIPYAQNEDGSINYGKTAEAMKRISKETVSAEKIENALRSSLTPDELNQLSINGRYQFKEYQTPEELSIYSTTKFKNREKEIDDNIKKLKSMSELSTSNAGEKNKYDAIITSLEMQKSSLSEKLTDELEMINKDPEYAKFVIYKEGAINQFANAYSWEHNKMNFLTNPVLEARHWERTFKLNQDKFEWDKVKDTFNMEMSEKNYQLDKKAAGEEEGEIGKFTVTGGVSTKTLDPYVSFKNDAFQYEDNKNNTFNQLLGLYKGDKNAGPIDANILRNALSKYEKGDKTAIPSKFSALADAYIEQSTKATFMQNVLQNAENKVWNNPEYRQQKNQINQEVNSVNKGKGFQIKDGTYYTNDEIFNMLQKEKSSGWTGRTVTVGTSSSRSISTNVLDNIDEASLTPRERKLYNYLKISDEGKTEEQRVINENWIKPIRTIVNKNTTLLKDVNKEMSSLLKNNISGWAPEEATIETPKPEAKYKMEGRVSKLLLKYNEDFSGIPGGAENFTKSEREEVAKWITGPDKDDVHYGIMTQGNNHYISLTKGNEVKFVPLTSNEYSQLPRNESSKTPTERELEMFIQAGNGNTNITGDTKDAIFKEREFSNVRQLQIRADVQEIYGGGDNNKLLQFKLNVSKDPSNPEWLFLEFGKEHSMNSRGIMNTIKAINDTQILQYYLDNNNSLTDEQRKKVYELIRK